ncbi:MAG: D-glycero-beta-D-manno-heptose-7-phosphate kinase, partial [Deltaproteobacteria bacterium]
MVWKRIIGKIDLDELFGRFARAKVLVVGDLILDQFIWGKVERISPEAPVPVVEVEKESRLLGGAANVAHNIRTLGGQVEICGLLGGDSEGEELW